MSAWKTLPPDIDSTCIRSGTVDTYLNNLTWPATKLQMKKVLKNNQKKFEVAQTSLKFENSSVSNIINTQVSQLGM